MKQDNLQGVSIIISTNRPQFFANILANYKSQLYKLKELIIVLNKDSMDLSKYRKIVRGHRQVSVFKLPEKVSLGMCLNFAASKTKYPVITKFDDDDYYSPHYLVEQMRALLRSGADVIGKRAYMSYLESRKLLILRFPTKRNKFVGLVAGGTILFKRRVFNHVRFPNTSLGEDVAFLSRCRAKGYKIYAPSPYNYVQIRRKNKQSHTWTAGDDYLLKGSLILARTDKFRELATRP
ncbi:glycosyltransferase family 2 protein [Paenibacillus sp. SI8]|uniref:glycosyltransferase n=1 Tax=unclassified Paenibacillus TaxID=185978 RepID=UPI0034664793